MACFDSQDFRVQLSREAALVTFRILYGELIEEPVLHWIRQFVTHQESAQEFSSLLKQIELWKKESSLADGLLADLHSTLEQYLSLIKSRLAPLLVPSEGQEQITEFFQAYHQEKQLIQRES